MGLGPKHSLHPVKKENHSAMREFTDREEPTKSFMDALDEKVVDRYKVLTYYGVGGIGKSRLQRELYRKLEFRDPSVVKAILDFKEEKHRTPSEALIWLREELKKQYKIKFTTFDLAYIIYWKKLNPQVSLKSTDTALPFLEEGTFIGDVIYQLENVPVAQWFPKTLKFITGMAKYKDIVQWWMGNGKAVLEQLQDMLPTEIEEMLSVYWAADVREYLTKQSVSAVIFIDTYEALWEKTRQQGSFYEKDAWVQELVLQLPEVLWVICGREKIQWGKTNPAWNDETYLEQHLMGELSEVDSDKFLQSCGIMSKEIRMIITEASHGLPYYLDLAVDTYNVVSQKNEPQPNDFSKTPQKILDRFLMYLEQPEKETLKVLSFTRYWTTDLFRYLVTEFSTGFPVTAYLELFRFSFITKEAEREWQMHAMMRASLQEDVQETDPDLCRHVHVALFNYYERKWKQADSADVEKRRFFEEAFYHGKQALSAPRFFDWFLDKGQQLKSAGQFHLLSAHYEELQTAMAQESELAVQAAIHQFYGEIYLLQGSYEQAVCAYEAAMDDYRNGTDANPETAKAMGRCSIDLAEIMIHINQYDEAYAHLAEGADGLNRFTGQKDEAYYISVLLQAVRLGKLDIRFARYEAAMANYERAIRTSDEAVAQIGGTSGIFALTALAYEKLGELYGTERETGQEDCYVKAIAYYEKALNETDVQDSVRIRANMGLAYKRLGEYYSVTDNPSEKIRSFTRALAIYDQVLEQSPYFVDALEKKGHAAVDYMVLQIELNLLQEAMETFKEAVETFELVIELSPKQGGSRNRLASVHRDLSRLYLKRNEPQEALAILHESLRLSEIVLTETPDYIYTHNSLGKTHEQLADVYAAVGDKKLAADHYRQAIAHTDLMLQRAPGLKESVERKERIEGKTGWRLRE